MGCKELGMRHDIVRPGMSIGHHALDGGTITAIVRRKNGSEPYILSCLHVLQTRYEDPDAGIVQPGKRYGEREGNKAGKSFKGVFNRNTDAAIASLVDREVDSRLMLLDFAPLALGRVKKGDIVAKVGSTTCLTFGRVTHEDKPRKLFYSNFGRKKLHGFCIKRDRNYSDENQPLSGTGDSGAAWLLCDSSGNPTPTLVGIHAAGEAGRAFACHADIAFAALGIVLND